MTGSIRTHRETALESPYSRDRREAIEELAGIFPGADDAAQRRILETFREVANGATSSTERDLARETMVEAFEAAPETAGPVVVPCFCDLAADASRSDERLDAVDALRGFYPSVGEELRERIEETLTDIAENGTYEDERRRARHRLADVADHDGSSRGAGDDGSAVDYLGQSLAEQLADATDESTEACCQRAEELREFLDDNPVDDDGYESVRADVADLAEQLAVVPTNGGLDDDRKRRVERIAERTKRLYVRGG
jgi:hypothetical protein